MFTNRKPLDQDRESGLVPKLLRFTDAALCFKCGFSDAPENFPQEGEINRLVPTIPATTTIGAGAGAGAAVDLPMPPVPPIAFVLAGGFSKFRVTFCAGGKGPESEEAGELAGILTTIASITGGDASRIPLPRKLNLCAGIGEEHLHVTCLRCGYEMLMEPKDRAAAAPEDLSATPGLL